MKSAGGGHCLSSARAEEIAAPLPPGSSGGTAQAGSGRQSRRRAAAAAAAGPAASGFETPEGPGWKWLVVALAVYIVADKSGNLPGLPPVEYDNLSVSSGSFDFAASPSTAWISALREPWSAGRKLSGGSSSTSSGSSSSGSDSHASHGSHPHEAMFFLVGSIVVSAMIMHISMKVKGIQQTVVLFVLGVFLALIVQGGDLEDKLGPAGRSYTMWMQIDPHLLLFTLLPPLLAGDAMGIDTSIVRKVGNQCLYLAGPGVAINAGIVALFLYYYLGAIGYSWSFLLCLTTGAILCATDPVAVVALLKELGASPTLTVQIQGESLLNDGTAIVLYTVSYNMLKGDDYDAGDVIVFLVKCALYAWILGMVIGGLFFLWIRGAKNKLSHNSSLIQVSLTIACAYSSFVVAEGLFHISGVLSTVAASLVLAHKMWPEVVSHETMHTIWHVFEYLGNTIIFFLAGSLTGSIMARIPIVDFVHLIVIYMFLVIVRSSLILLSRPLLRLLHAEKKPVALPDALVMSWGGLRGAVGLALAIQVSIDRAGGTLSQESADKVLFYVGGVALLTLAVNATTCPMLVKHLGITQTPEVKLKLMTMLHDQMQDTVATGGHPAQVVAAVQEMLDDVQHHLNLHSTDGLAEETAKRNFSARGSQLIHGAPQLSSAIQRASHLRGSITMGCAADTLLKDFEFARDHYHTIPEHIRMKLQNMMGNKNLSEDQLDEMAALLSRQEVDPKLTRAVNEAFLNLVRADYWHRIESGDMSTAEGSCLLLSITNALSAPSMDLNDLSQIIPQLKWTEEEGDQDPAEEAKDCGSKSINCLTVSWEESFQPLATRQSMQKDQQPNQKEPCVRRVVESTAFSVTVMTAIVINSAVVFAEEAVKDSAAADSPVWMVLEFVFTFIFLVEFIFKFLDQKLRFFCDAWNVLDFLLVLNGVFTIISIIALEDGPGSDGNKSSVARSVRVLKILRAMRLVRLIKLVQVLSARLAGNESQLVVAEHMHKFDTLYHFIGAHINAQQDMLKFFGRKEKSNAPELARCILQAQTAVYAAMVACLQEEASLEPWVVAESHVCHMSVQVTSELEEFTLSARDGGVLTATEAESIMHAMHDHIAALEKRCTDLRTGRAGAPVFIKSTDKKAYQAQEASQKEAAPQEAPAEGAAGEPAAAAAAPQKDGDPAGVANGAAPPSPAEEPAGPGPAPGPDTGLPSEHKEESGTLGATDIVVTESPAAVTESPAAEGEIQSTSEAGSKAEAGATGPQKTKKKTAAKSKAKVKKQTSKADITK